MRGLKRSLVFFLGAFMLAGTASLSGEVGSLIQFQPNTTARSSEVNQNFNRIRDAVNDNNNRINALESSKQNRVTGDCPTGQAIRVINPDGTVVCTSPPSSRVVSSLSKGRQTILEGTAGILNWVDILISDAGDTELNISVDRDAQLIIIFTAVCSVYGPDLTTTQSRNFYVRVLVNGATVTPEYVFCSSDFTPNTEDGWVTSTVHTIVSVTAGNHTVKVQGAMSLQGSDGNDKGSIDFPRLTVLIW